jgi:hypothetical protein
MKCECRPYWSESGYWVRIRPASASETKLNARCLTPGPAHPETSYYIRYRGAVYADTGNFSRCIRLWMYALEMQQSMLEPLSPMTNSSLLSFAELFSFMMAERDTESRNGRASQRLPDPQQVREFDFLLRIRLSLKLSFIIRSWG